MNDVRLTVYDYVVFSVLIPVTIILPLYLKFRVRKKSTKAEYAFAAAHKISSAAMLMSLARGVLGVRSFLGYPAELYYRGTSMYEIIYGLGLAYPIAAYFFVPVYYNLKITSVYQYLDLRFKSHVVRSLASACYILRNILNTGVTIFTPCVALKTILNLPYWSTIIGITVISTICAFLGGLKAVILMDVIQGTVSFVSILIIIAKGTFDAGGFDQVFKINRERDRIRFFNFDLDPTIRVATVSAFFGQLFMSLSIFGCQQNFVQRYCSMDSLKNVQKILWINLPLVVIIFSVVWLAGGVIFANYADCDPVMLGSITEIDEIVPYYVSHSFQKFPGFAGIFIAVLFNGSLSLTVSNLNSMAIVAWEDFLGKIPCLKHFKDHQQLLMIKLLVVFIGILIVGVAFGIALLPGLIESSQLVTSATSGPLLGVFALALFFPSTNARGATWGMMAGLAMTLFLMTGRLFANEEIVPYLPLSIAGCTNQTLESANGTFGKVHARLENVDRVDSSNRNILSYLFRITFMYYGVIGTGCCVILGLIVSWFSGNEENDAYDEKLIHPIALKLSKICPGKPRKYLMDVVESNKTKSVNSSCKVKSVTEKISMS